MELWIRSQDKERLIKVENLYVEFNGDVDPKLQPYRIVTDKFINLGIYKNYERALEVLDEIQEVLCPKVLIMKSKSQITISDNVNLVLPDNCSYERIGDTYVYEMPEE